MTERRHATVVLIEDNPADIETIRRAIDGYDHDIDLDTITSGTKANRILRDAPSNNGVRDPDLFLLDLNLPGTDGRELLKQLNSDRWSNVPVVVMTTSGNNDDIQHAYRNGANAYVIKPGPYEEFMATVQSICNFWLNRNGN